ncbi:MAG: MarR family transcriptional regulator [Nocardia sp.]|uniref:MarR family winged helix-turn-helix transcriptional regulator n=1 Tax=Nocardia sp. TaxID=1821 RepID=UPI002622DE8C|nr:MarR family transcriptional regulator [Nocardia sp.]MCU1643002.1 MarR family transcriptional regulator [Nocardia sp.]
MGTDEQPRWLDDEEQQAWISLVGTLIRLPAALDAQLQRDAAINHFEYQVMSALSMSQERTLRMSVLAALCGGSLARLSQAVGRLEKRGWVSRAPDPTDGRYTLATLTDEGFGKVEESAPGHVEAVRRYVFDPLTKAQVQQLTRIGRRIGDAIDPEGCPDSRRH